MPATVSAVIFDCDGTLVDSETISLAVLIECVGELGLHVPYEEALERFAGNELSVVFRELESRLGRSLPEGFLDTFRSRQMGVLKEQLQPVPGAAELLRSIDVPFCVASNAPRNKIDLCLATTGLKSFFAPSLIFSAYDIQKWKPAPDLFLQAADVLGVPPNECAVIEDSMFGVKAGLAAGMQVIAFDPHQRLAEQFPDIRAVGALSDVRACLEIPEQPLNT